MTLDRARRAKVCVMGEFGRVRAESVGRTQVQESGEREATQGEEEEAP